MNWLIRNVLVSVLLSVGLHGYIYYTEIGSFPTLSNEWPGMLLAFLLTTLGIITLHYIHPYFEKHITWTDRRALRFITEIVVTLALSALLGAIYFMVMLQPNPNENRNISEAVLRLSIILLVLSYLNAQIKFSLYSYNQYSVVQIENMKILRDQMNLRFQALKSQLNPHFLFNSLNTISSLAYRDRGLAESYIRKLSDMYSYLLGTEQKGLITLREELKILDTYFYMQKIKYQDRIVLKIMVPEELAEVSIPPLTLQLLVENALKHNHISDAFPLHIKVIADEDHISVSNNVNPVKDGLSISRADSLHIGLSNIRNRYSYFTQQQVEIVNNGAFTVRLPQLNQTADAT